jgi:hypothetical protein
MFRGVPLPLSLPTFNLSLNNPCIQVDTIQVQKVMESSQKKNNVERGMLHCLLIRKRNPG